MKILKASLEFLHHQVINMSFEEAGFRSLNPAYSCRQYGLKAM